MSTRSISSIYPEHKKSKEIIVSQRYVPVNRAMCTPQFVLICLMLCANTSATIGIIGVAALLLQEIFGGQLIGVPLEFSDLSTDQLAKTATIGAAFTGLF